MDTEYRQPYVYCGVCFTSEGPFHLTTCAHLVCAKHRPQGRQECPCCKTEDISTVQLNNEELPSALKPYFKNFLPELENIYAISKFQFEGLERLVSHQKEVIKKMESKIHQQKEVMKSVREELVKARDYKA